MQMGSMELLICRCTGSRLEVFCKKIFFGKCCKIHWKQLCRSPLLIKLQLKRDSGSGVFRVNFKKFLRAVFLQNTIPILVYWYLHFETSIAWNLLITFFWNMSQWHLVRIKKSCNKNRILKKTLFWPKLGKMDHKWSCFAFFERFYY